MRYRPIGYLAGWISDIRNFRVVRHTKCVRTSSVTVVLVDELPALVAASCDVEYYGTECDIAAGGDRGRERPAGFRALVREISY